MFRNITEFLEYATSLRGRNPSIGTVKADTAIAKCVAFQDSIGNPENNLNIVHIAGTSGKGSTAQLMARGLLSQGFSVGVGVSPHLVSITERFLINNKPISELKLLHYANTLYPKFESFGATSLYGPLSFFEMMIAMQFYIFDKENLAYCVMETGVGGRLDATNIPLESKICVLNSIGLDHTHWLGETVELIAVEKAEIMQPNSLTIALSQTQSINKIFQQIADKNSSELDFVIPNFDFNSVVLSRKENTLRTCFNYVDQDLREHQLQLQLCGEYQAVNCALALRAIETIADKDDWTIDWAILIGAINKLQIEGRFEQIDYNDKPLILDGAHNPQKMYAFLGSLFKVYTDDKFNLILAFKDKKDVDAMLAEVIKYRDNWNCVIITSFEVNQDMPIKSVEVDILESKIIELGITNYRIEPNIATALELISTLEPEVITVITGSLYLVGGVKKIINDIT